MQTIDISNNIIGQSRVKEVLNNIYLSKRVPHAFLFYGPSGSGKFFTAIEFLKMLNSSVNDSSSEKFFRNISTLSEPAVKLIFALPRGKGETGDDTSYEKLSADTLATISSEISALAGNPYHMLNIPGANTIKISSIRDIKKYSNLTDKSNYIKAVIIYDAELMADEAQNALLKVLEEPPEGFIFFLLTSVKEKLLPTILSRCWQVKFSSLSNEETKTVLVKYFNIDQNKAELLSAFGDGSLETCLNLLKYDINAIMESAVQTIRYSLAKKYYLAFKTIEDSIEITNKEYVAFFIGAILKWLLDANKYRFNAKIDYFSTYKDTIEKFNSKFNTIDISKTINKLEQFSRLIDNNINLNIILQGIIFELSSLSLRN